MTASFGLATARTAVTGIVLLAAAVTASMETAFAQPGGSQARTPEGVWAVTATPRDCASGASLGPPVRSLITYHQGGTVSESAALALLAPGQRTLGHGTWAPGSGSTWVERLASIVVFDSATNPPGLKAGWVVSAQTITLTDADNFTSTGGVTFFDLNRQPYRQGCATRVGERFR
jgi:hypothetical protein